MEDDRVETLRRHWDARYAIPGRVPLDQPNDGFVAWIERHDDDRPVLVIGDGEGRNARAVPARHPVTMVELSPVGAHVCRRRAMRPMEIVVADAFTFLRDEARSWPLVAMLYMQRLTASELEVLLRVARTADACYIEQARVALPSDHAEQLADAAGAEWEDASRPNDDVERVRLVADSI